MEDADLRSAAAYVEQLKRYAEDFRRVYLSEREKAAELEAACLQLFRYAKDVKKTFFDLDRAHHKLQEAYIDTIHRLVLAAEYKDEDTADHIIRMSRYSSLLAEKAGWSEQDRFKMLYAAPMHDVGKIGIPDHILMKPGRLTGDEFDTMKNHTTIGAKILTGSEAEILKLGCQIAFSHHERWDGKGYPQGLSGERIPMAGRIVALADVFDALTSKRPYKEPYPVPTALHIIEKERKAHFDPELTDLFLQNVDSLLRIKAEIVPVKKVNASDFVDFNEAVDADRQKKAAGLQGA